MATARRKMGVMPVECSWILYPPDRSFLPQAPVLIAILEAVDAFLGDGECWRFREMVDGRHAQGPATLTPSWMEPRRAAAGILSRNLTPEGQRNCLTGGLDPDRLATLLINWSPDYIVRRSDLLFFPDDLACDCGALLEFMAARAIFIVQLHRECPACGAPTDASRWDESLVAYRFSVEFYWHRAPDSEATGFQPAFIELAERALGQPLRPCQDVF